MLQQLYVHTCISFSCMSWVGEWDQIWTDSGNQKRLHKLTSDLTLWNCKPPWYMIWYVQYINTHSYMQIKTALTLKTHNCFFFFKTAAITSSYWLGCCKVNPHLFLFCCFFQYPLVARQSSLKYVACVTPQKGQLVIRWMQHAMWIKNTVMHSGLMTAMV